MNYVSMSAVAERFSAPSLDKTRFLNSFDTPLPPAERSQFLEQVYEEYCQLHDRGEKVDPDEFCDRFPNMRTSLRRLIDIHCQIAEYADDLPVPELKGTWPGPGEVCLGFHLLQELGRGAFARVFLATERAVGNRLVVVKISMRDDREADTLGKLAHPNVVPIFSAQYDGGKGFSTVCMPFLGSATLCNVLDQLGGPNTQRPRYAHGLLEIARDDRWENAGAPPPARPLRDGSFVDGVVYLGSRLAHALAYVHGHKILHRDLKPSNILLCPNGEPVLIDFNLALNNHGAYHRIGGTIPYMPPEQLSLMEKGKRHDPVPTDARTDLYAMGVLMYELLAGAHPFGPAPLKSKSQEMVSFLLERQHQGPRSLRELNPQVDARLEALVARCLSHDPAARPSSAHELADLLRRYQAPLCRATRWVARHSRVAAAVGFMAVASAGAGAYELATMPTAAVRHAQTGDQHYREGRLPEAVLAFSESLKQNADQPELRFKRGRVLQQMGEWDAALDDFKLVLQTADETKKGRVLACMGYCVSHSENDVGAIQYYRDAVAANFDNAEVFNNLSFHLSRRSESDAAEQAATAALQRNPGLQVAYFNRAVAVMRLAMTGRNDKQETIDPESGVKDVERALHGLPGTERQFHVAATLCALAAEFHHQRIGDPKSPYSQKGKEFTRLAILRGASRDDLMNDDMLKHWVKALPNVSAEPNPTSNRWDQVADPLQGSIDY